MAPSPRALACLLAACLLAAAAAPMAVDAAACATSGATPKNCLDAHSCVDSTADVCAVCAADHYLSDSARGVCRPFMTPAQPSILGSAEGFTVMGASTVTNVGPTAITGDLGVSPGTAITGFPPGIIVGVKHATDDAANSAHADAGTAYAALAGKAATTTMTGTNLGGKTLAPGVYKFASSALQTGTLTLDAQGDESATFTFQVGSSFTADPNSAVVLINGARACNVYWQVGSSATINSGVDFTGTIISYASVSLATGAKLDGRALALNGAVTLLSNLATRFSCTEASCAGPSFMVEASTSRLGSSSTVDTCVACHESCASCTSADATACTQCATGYSANTAGLCV